MTCGQTRQQELLNLLKEVAPYVCSPYAKLLKDFWGELNAQFFESLFGIQVTRFFPNISDFDHLNRQCREIDQIARAAWLKYTKGQTEKQHQRAVKELQMFLKWANGKPPIREHDKPKEVAACWSIDLLAALGDTRAVPLLKKLIKSPGTESYYREAASNCLKTITKP